MHYWRSSHSVEPEFRCRILTEIGLISQSYVVSDLFPLISELWEGRFLEGDTEKRRTGIRC
jgi:hypothetical protein